MLHAALGKGGGDAVPMPALLLGNTGGGGPGSPEGGAGSGSSADKPGSASGAAPSAPRKDGHWGCSYIPGSRR